MIVLWSSPNHIPIKYKVWLRKQATYFLISPRFALVLPRLLYFGSFLAIIFSIYTKKEEENEPLKIHPL